MKFNRFSPAAVAAGFAIAVFAAVPASAASFSVATTDGAGTAEYSQGSSDPFHKVCDVQNDGLRAVSFLTGTSGGVSRTWYIEDPDGAYNPGANRFCTTVARNLTDGTSATIRVCLRNGASGPLQKCRQSTFTVR